MAAPMTTLDQLSGMVGDLTAKARKPNPADLHWPKRWRITGTVGARLFTGWGDTLAAATTELVLAIDKFTAARRPS